ncbi:MAG TPA: methyltransferase domain-containing protein [Gammaproteobacteria bacterium]|nr:methyltransferase domain-containing protein [Gammaproteobacteria bacterium]
MSGQYIIGGGASGAARLDVLAATTWPASESFLQAAGLGDAKTLLDAGCGNGAITLRIAAGIGRGAAITGLDRDAGMIRFAREAATSQNLPVKFLRCDLEHEPPPGGGYDLVYARLLLSHLRDPEAALGKLAAALAPGGILAAEDVDFEGHYCRPSCAAFSRYVVWYEAAARLRGADPRLGPRLFALFRAAGITRIRRRSLRPAFREGDGKWMALLTLRAIREAVLGAGIATAAEIAATEIELEAFTRSPDSILSLPRFHQVSGRRP